MSDLNIPSSRLGATARVIAMVGTALWASPSKQPVEAPDAPVAYLRTVSHAKDGGLRMAKIDVKTGAVIGQPLVIPEKEYKDYVGNSADMTAAQKKSVEERLLRLKTMEGDADAALKREGSGWWVRKFGTPISSRIDTFYKDTVQTRSHVETAQLVTAGLNAEQAKALSTRVQEQLDADNPGQQNRGVSQQTVSAEERLETPPKPFVISYSSGPGESGRGFERVSIHRLEATPTERWKRQTATLDEYKSGSVSMYGPSGNYSGAGGAVNVAGWLRDNAKSITECKVTASFPYGAKRYLFSADTNSHVDKQTILVLNTTDPRITDAAAKEMIVKNRGPQGTRFHLDCKTLAF
jgi:hypothetical protein